MPAKTFLVSEMFHSCRNGPDSDGRVTQIQMVILSGQEIYRSKITFLFSVGIDCARDGAGTKAAGKEKKQASVYHNPS